MELLALIFVPPLTDFSKDPDIMAAEYVAMSSAGRALYRERLGVGGGIGGLWDIPRRLLRGPQYCDHGVFTMELYVR